MAGRKQSTYRWSSYQWLLLQCQESLVLIHMNCIIKEKVNRKSISYLLLYPWHFTVIQSKTQINQALHDLRKVNRAWKLNLILCAWHFISFSKMSLPFHHSSFSHYLHGQKVLWLTGDYMATKKDIVICKQIFIHKSLYLWRCLYIKPISIGNRELACY